MSGCIGCGTGLIMCPLALNTPLVQLRATPNKARTYSHFLANIMDFKPIMNIPSLGICTSLTNPAVAAAKLNGVPVFMPLPSEVVKQRNKIAEKHSRDKDKKQERSLLRQEMDINASYDQDKKDDKKKVPKITPVPGAPCVPVTMYPWIPHKPVDIALGFPALRHDRTKLICVYGGIIKFVYAGQPKVQIK